MNKQVLLAVFLLVFTCGCVFGMPGTMFLDSAYQSIKTTAANLKPISFSATPLVTSFSIEKTVAGTSSATGWIIAANCANGKKVSIIFDTPTSSPIIPLLRLAETWSDISQHYLYRDKVNFVNLAKAAMSTIVSKLGDQYSRCLTTETEIKQDDSNNLATQKGLNIVVSGGPDEWENCLAVYDVGDNSSASKSGIATGDIIIDVNGTSTYVKSIWDFARSLSSSKAETVTLNIIRKVENKYIPIRIVAKLEPVEAQQITWWMEKDNIGDKNIAYLHLSVFHGSESRVYKTLEVAARALKRAGAEKMIFSLKGNGGGYLVIANAVLSAFLGPGVKCVSLPTSPSTRVFTTNRAKLFEDWPVACIVDEYTASAAEIVSGCLRDAHRAILVGKKTFGKGIAQDEFDIPGYWRIWMTCTKYFTLGGHCPQGLGWIPGVLVGNPSQRIDGRDPFIAKAIEVLSDWPESMDDMSSTTSVLSTVSTTPSSK
ncbi:MAG: S41 family peptidase [Candidatus Paceibacterota bacterium]|jgi:carboxyl-terminal processing protease